MILAGFSRVDLASIKWAGVIVQLFISERRQAIDLGNFKVLRYLSADIKRISVIVGIWMFYKAKIKPTLGVESAVTVS